MTALGTYEVHIFVRRDRMVDGIAALSGRSIGAVTGGTSRTAATPVPFAESFQARIRENFIEDKVRPFTPLLPSILYGILVNEDLPKVHLALNDAIAKTIIPAHMTGLHENWLGRDRSIVVHPRFTSVR